MSCGTSSAAFSRGSRTPVRIASGRLADENPRFSGCGTSRAAFHGASCTPVGQRPAPRTSAPCALRVRNRVFNGRNLTRRVPRNLMYSSRPKARTAHIAPVRLAHQNLLFKRWNLACCVPGRQRARCGPLAYWSTLGIAHGASLATSPVENAAHQVPPLQTRVLACKASGGDAY